jgi:Protein of unknown function (DUF3099)
MDLQTMALLASHPGDRPRGRNMTRNRLYFILMGGCIAAVILAWTVVRLFSVTAAVVISVAVGLVPPIAAIIANAGDEASRGQQEGGRRG